MDKVILSEKDSRRVEEAIRKIEARARAIMPYYRRRSRPTPGKGSEIFIAYCKYSAGAGNEIECFLDRPYDHEKSPEDPSQPSVVTVHCTICGALTGELGDLDEAIPRLEGTWPFDGAGYNHYPTKLRIIKESDGEWWALQIFQATEGDCA